MMAVPNHIYQKISMVLSAALYAFLEGKPCKVYPFDKYWAAGVCEYWIVDPEARVVSVYALKDGHYIAVNYDDTAAVQVTVLPGCVIDLKAVFAE
jgi:Uma2 family endonuclease